MPSSGPPLSTPHRDGWRNEQFFEMVKDPACGSTLARLMTAVVTGDVPAKTIDILPSATLVVLLKKDQAAIKEQRAKTIASPNDRSEWGRR